MFYETDIPYCKCDDWGLVGEGFFHDDQCISIDFLIAVCVGGVALILLILCITICCLSCCMARLETELEDIQENKSDEYPFSKSDTLPMTNPMYERNWSNPAIASDNETRQTSTDQLHRGHSNSSLHRGNDMNGFDKYSSKKRDSDLYMPEPDNMGYANNGYFPEPGAPWDSKRSDITDTEAYRNFSASVSHIDPKANYNIKRPSFAIRPTDNLYNMENDRDHEVPSFRI